MKNFIVLVFLLISVKTYGQASPAVIFNAGYGKVIPEFGLRFKDNKTLISGADNPSVTATDAPIGSIYISSNGLTYQKQDNGSTTNWTPLYFVPIFTDDNRLVRTDGTDNVQQSGVTLNDSDAMSGLTSLDVDLINLDSYIISTTATDQALELRPNGVGTVDIPYLTNGAALFAGSNGAISEDFANYQYSILDGLKVDNIRLNDNTISSTDTNGDIIIDPDGTGLVNIPYIGNNHVVYTGPSGNLRGENAFSYNQSTNILRVDGVDIGGTSTITTHTGDQSLTLDASGAGIIDVNAPINLESVTANQVAFSDGITGNITGSANFTYDSLVNSFTAGALNFIDGIISSTALNGNVTISPDGTGETVITSPLEIDSGVNITGSTITGTNGAADLILAPAALRQIELTGDTEINNLFFPAAVGDGAYITTNLNQDITLAADGTGELSVLTPADIEQVRVQDNAVTTNVTNGNVTLLTNGTGDATVTYGTNELSLNPTSGRDSLLKNPSFETGEIEYACTNATGAIVASTIPSQNDARMFQMTVTAAGGYCDFIAPTGAKFEGLPFVIGGLFQTELLDVEYCTLVNGAESNCIPVNAIADDTTDPFNKALSTQDLSGATSNGLRIKTTTSTSGVINSSKIALDLGTLPTGQAISCNGDLDCENEISFYYNLTTVVDQFGNSYPVTKGGSANYAKTVDISSLGLQDKLNCSSSTIRYETFTSVNSTNTTLFFYTSYDVSGGTFRDYQASIVCQKTGRDFKPIVERGVVNVGELAGDTDWKAYTPTTGLTGGTASLDGRWRKVGDSMEVKISASWSSIFTGGTPTFTLPAGYEIDLDKFPNGTASSSFTLLGRAFLEDSGAGSASSPYYADVLYSSTTGVIIKYAGNIASNAFPASLDPISTTLPFTWANGDSIYMTFTVPIVGWSSSKQIVASLNQLGVKQTWQDLTASRSSGTTYTNETDSPIMVTVRGDASNANFTMTAVVDGVTIGVMQHTLGGYDLTIPLVVPPKSTYSVTVSNGAIVGWTELRK